MRPGRTHYETLGVEHTASPDEIKAQYRRLAKRYHPDVTRMGDVAAAHATFVEITEAYQTLVDARRRELYDRELKRREAERAHATPPPRTQSATATRPRPAAAPPRARPRPDLASVIINARVEFSRGRLQAAQALCEEIIRRDRRHAGAHSLLGDIFRAQGRTDEAIRMYTVAIQLNPRSQSDMQKLERLVNRDRRAWATKGRWSPALRAAAAAGSLLYCGLVLLPLFYRGQPLFPEFGPLSAWTDNLLLCMAGGSLLLGFLISMLGLVDRLDDDFLLASIRTGGGAVPVGLLMLLVSILFFPLALLFYAAIAVMQEAYSPSMLRLLGFSVAGVLLFSLTVENALAQTLLFGGNVVFPCMVLGSFVGGMLREPFPTR